MRGCLRRCAGKSSSQGNLPKYGEAANTDLRNVFQICSSTAFGLASPPVSLKLSRPRPLPGARNESTAFAESLRAVECVPGRKKSSQLGGALSNSLNARSREMVERLILNSEQCVLCLSGRAKVVAALCRALHPLVNARRCVSIDAGDSAVTRPSSQPRQSAWRHLSASSARYAL